MSSPPPQITVNGRTLDIDGESTHQNLLRFLRERGLTGSKEGCAEGDCGACTCLLVENDAEGEPVYRALNSCIAPLYSMAGRQLVTAEGLADDDGDLHPAQQAMVDRLGSQCGFCTPGIVCSMAEGATWDKPDQPAVADLLCGNLCRCTGYRPIRDAAEVALQNADSPQPRPASCEPLESFEHISKVGDLQFHRPSSLPQLFELLDQNPEARLVAGATEIGVEINKMGREFPVLISTEAVADLKMIQRHEGQGWHFGGAATFTDIEIALAGAVPVWDAMSNVFASRQIRNRATLAGNIVTASPIGDSAPVLLALDATVVAESIASGIRHIPIHEFFEDYRKTALKSDEIVRSIYLPEPPANLRSAFYKVSKRREMDISIVSGAFAVREDENGIVTQARVAYGGVAATPIRATEAEKLIVGRPLRDSLSDVVACLRKVFTPLDDVRGSANYRNLVVTSLWFKFVIGEESAAVDRPQTWQGIRNDEFEKSNGTDASRDLIHESAVGHVTGKARYIEDNAIRRGCLQAWPVLSTEARAKIVSVNTFAAEMMPGVAAILTKDDVPGINNVGPVRHDEPLFAEDEVFYHGQIIAIVIAETRDYAKAAAAAVEIEYDVNETPIVGLSAAIEQKAYHTEPHILSRGDSKSALDTAPHVLEGTFELGGQEQFYLETQTSWAEAIEDGSFFVQASTQHPSEIQAIVAEVLGLQRNQITVEAPRMGGGFGGKETQGNPWAAAMCIASAKTGKPCAVQLDRDIDMAVTGKRHPFHATFRVGYDDDGRLLTCEVDLVSDGGWALDLSVPVTDRALFHLDNAYFIPNVHFTGRVARTNTCSHTAFRGFGGPQGMLVIEEIIARIAGERNLRPEVVRSLNFYHGEGETNMTHYGADIGDNRLTPIWNQLLKSSQFSERRKEVDVFNAMSNGVKRGLAVTPVKFGISFTLKHYNQAGALVLVYADGTCQVNHGGTEMGQGLNTKIQGIAMRALGLPAEKVRMMHTRTDKIPNTSATAASASTDLNGAAVLDACEQIRARLRPVAAKLLEAEPEDVVFADDQVTAGDASMPMAELCDKAYGERIQLSAAGFYKTPDLKWDWEVGEGRPFYYYAFGAAVTEVEVDGYTGMHKVLRTDIVHDVGDSLNPGIDRGQIEGGFVQGLGWLTREELKWADDGRLLSHSASTYAIPAFSDAPADFRVDLFKADADSQPQTVGRSKAVGEPPLMLAISVREALRDAVGAFRGASKVGIVELASPATCEAIYKAAHQV